MADQNDAGLRSEENSAAINAATRSPGDRLFQIEHVHGEPDGSVTMEHIGLIYAADAEHARSMAAVLFFLPHRQLTTWAVHS